MVSLYTYEDIFQSKEVFGYNTYSYITVNMDDFVIYIVARNIEYGAVLMQYRKVTAYNSILLKEHKRNNPTHHLEFGVVVFALKLWNHYLYWFRFEAFEDHECLRYISSTQQDLNFR